MGLGWNCVRVLLSECVWWGARTHGLVPQHQHCPLAHTSDGQGCALMWGAVTQLPARALGLGVLVWGHLLSLGLWALSLCFLWPLRVLYVCVQMGRAGLTAACSVALTAHVCGVYVLLQGLAWAAQLVGSWVSLHLRLFCALLETLRRIPFRPPCEQVAWGLVRAVMWAGGGLGQVWGVATCVQLCARTLFLGTCLCLHTCLAAVSSKIHVRVHTPLRFSLRFGAWAPLTLGLKVRLLDWRQGRAQREEPEPPQGATWEEQKPRKPRRPKPTRRRQVSPSRPGVVPSAATLIIVVCVGFLVLMVVLGLVRIHSLHRRVSGTGGSPGASSDPKDPDLFWDDSALTIIVNPMESYQSRQAGVVGAAGGGQQEDEDSSDSEAADSPSSDERRIIESPPHRY